MSISSVRQVIGFIHEAEKRCTPFFEKVSEVYQKGKEKIIQKACTIVDTRHHGAVREWADTAFDIFVFTSILLRSFSFITTPVLLIRTYSLIKSSDSLDAQFAQLKPTIIRGIYLAAVVTAIGLIAHFTWTSITFSVLLFVVGHILEKSDYNKPEALLGLEKPDYNKPETLPVLEQPRIG